MRTVVSSGAGPTSASTILTLSSPWTVTPDATSQFSVTTTIYNSAFYDNSDQFLNNQEGANLIGATEIEIWQGAYNVAIDSNSVQNADCGVLLASAGFVNTPNCNDPGPFNPCYFVEVVNNQITNSQGNGISYWSEPNTTEMNFIGTVVRGNTINGAVQQGNNLKYSGQGIMLASGDHEALTTLSIIEDNTVSNAPDGIDVFDDPNVLIDNNTFSDPTPVEMASSSSIAILLQNT